MNSNNSAKPNISKFNVLIQNGIKYKKTNYSNWMNKLSTTQISSNNDLSFINNSMLSTKLNSSESFLFKSIYINKNIKLFKMKNLSLKTQYYASTNSVNKNIYKNFIQNKFSENFKKLKINLELPKMENMHKSNSTYNIKNLKPNTGNSKQIQKISYFDQKFRNELYDIHNYNNQFGYNDRKNIMHLKESTKNRMLIRSYLYNKEKKYQKDLEDRNNYENKINKNSEKIHYIYNDVINNKINKEINYNSFLQEKIKEMRQIDFELYKYIEQLINQIKELFIQIKVKSDRLWHLFDIRNFLICVKEGISLKNLPYIFKCYNSEYLDELTKLNDKDIYSLEKKNKKNDNLNIFHIPTNLLLYIKSLNEVEGNNMDKKFDKYLDPNYKIFNSPDEFKTTYMITEKKVLTFLRNSLDKKNINDKIKIKLKEIIKDIENDNQIFSEDFNNVENHYNKVKINNENIVNRKLKLSQSTGNIKVKKIELYDSLNFNEKEIKRYIEEKKDEKFLKLIRGNNDVENTQFLYKFHQLKKLKKFETMKEYVYFYIYTNILNFMKIYPEYIYNQEIFDIKIFNGYINNIQNCNKFPEFVISSNIIYLLNIYENAINSFLYDYNNNIKKYGKTDTYKKIRKKEINEKKIFLFKKQKFFESKIKTMKINKYNMKFSKYRYIQRNTFLNDSQLNIFDKGKSFDNKTNKEKEKKIDEYKMLLKY